MHSPCKICLNTIVSCWLTCGLYQQATIILIQAKSLDTSSSVACCMERYMLSMYSHTKHPLSNGLCHDGLCLRAFHSLEHTRWTCSPILHMTSCNFHLRHERDLAAEIWDASRNISEIEMEFLDFLVHFRDVGIAVTKQSLPSSKGSPCGIRSW